MLYYTDTCSVSTFIEPTYLRCNKLFFEMLDIVEKKRIKFVKTHDTGQAVKEKVPLKKWNRHQAKEICWHGNFQDPVQLRLHSVHWLGSFQYFLLGNSSLFGKKRRPGRESGRLRLGLAHQTKFSSPLRENPLSYHEVLSREEDTKWFLNIKPGDNFTSKL